MDFGEKSAQRRPTRSSEIVHKRTCGPLQVVEIELSKVLRGARQVHEGAACIDFEARFAELIATSIRGLRVRAVRS